MRVISVTLVVFCIALIFLFPASTGPFSVVHGPATTLKAVHSDVLLQLVLPFWILVLSLLLAREYVIRRRSRPVEALAANEAHHLFDVLRV